MLTLEEKPHVVKKEKSFLPQLRELSNSLQEIESELSLFWRLSPAMFLVLRGDNTIKSSNPAWYKTLGYFSKDLQDINVVDIVHIKDKDKLLKTIQNIKDTQENVELSIKCKHKNKEIWHFVRWGLSYEPALDIVLCTCWVMTNKCLNCPFTF